MDFELFQYAFVLAVVGILYVVGNTYERPVSIKQDLKEKLGLESDNDLFEKRAREISDPNARRRTIIRV